MPVNPSPIPIYYAVAASRSISIQAEFTLENGVRLYFEDEEGRCYGSDGRIYYPVCVEEADALRVVGWSCEVDEECVLPEGALLELEEEQNKADGQLEIRNEE